MVANVFAGELRVAAAEANAAQIISWEPLHIPGLLQEPGYTKALLLGLPDPIRPSNEAIDSILDFRASRQHTVFQLRPNAICHFIFHEAALLELVAHPDRALVRRQLRRLMEAVSLRVTIQVANVSRGIHPWPMGPFYTVLQLDGSVLFLRERLTDKDSTFDTDPATVGSYKKEWAMLTADALSQEDSLFFIDRLLHDIS